MSNQYSAKPLSKPLKGIGITPIVGTFDTITANNLDLQSINIPGVFEDGILQNITIQDSELINTVVGVQVPNVGYFTELQTSADVTFLSNVGAGVSWDANTGDLYLSSTNGSFKVDGCSYLGNIEVCRNDILATNLNGDINVIPNNFGSIYLTGSVINVSTSGSFNSVLSNGGVSFVVDKAITLYSSHGTANLTTAQGQTFTTLNGDMSFNVDTALTRGNILQVFTSSGNIVVSSSLTHHLNSGDNISITNGSVNGSFKVANVLNDLTFTLTTTSGTAFFTTGGNFIKSISNNILLNTSSFVKIPTGTPLSFGDTTNSISGTSSGITVSSIGDIDFSLPSTNKIQVPQSTLLQFGTSGSNYINFNGTSSNINANTLNINTTNTRFSDPILSIGYTLTGNDSLDRGIEFPYYDTNSNTSKLGWFGWKNSAQSFAFLTNATNNNEVMAGSIGDLLLNSLTLSTINITTGGTIDMKCGKLLNVNLISGCSNTVTIAGSTNVTVNATNRISLASGTDILVPNAIPLRFGTSGSSITETSNSNLSITSSRNIQVNTTNGVLIPTNTILSFDGTSVGNVRVSSNTSGDLLVNASQNIFLTPSTGSVGIPSRTLLQFGTTSQSVSGSTSGGLNVVSSNSAIHLIANGNVSISSTQGDVTLYATGGNVRLLPSSSIVFDTIGNANSITNSLGTLLISGNSSNTLRTTNFRNIDLLASSSVNVPIGTALNIGDNQRFLVSDTTGTFSIKNTGTGGNISITSLTTNIQNTNGTLNILNNTTNVSSNSLFITGALAQFNTDNVRFKDPVITLGDTTLVSSDSKDRGVEYRYFATSGSMKLGWFGRKDTTNRFTFYSDAINTSEVITGTIGDLEVSNVFLRGGITFLSNPVIDMACGTIANVNTITGCTGVLNIFSTNFVNVSTGNFRFVTNTVQLPFNAPLVFGSTSNGASVSSDTNGNMTFNTNKVIFNSDIQINGTTTTVYSTVTNLQDPIVSLGGVDGPVINDLKDRGIEFKWNDNVNTKTGFFGYKNNIGRFVFIKDGVNNNEVYTGPYGDIQVGNGYFSNIQLSNGSVSGVSVLSGGALEIQATSGNISFSASSVLLPFNTPLSFGNTNNSIQSDTAGNVVMTSTARLTLLSQTEGINLVTSDFIRVPDKVPMYFGTSSNTFIASNSAGALSIVNSSGNIDLSPQVSTGSVNIPANNYLNFGDSRNSVYSDGAQLFLNGFEGISIASSSVTISGSVNILGTLLAGNTAIDYNQFILPLGTYEYNAITSVSNNTTGNGGNIQVTIASNAYLAAGDPVTLQNTTTSPPIDGQYTIDSVINPTTFTISYFSNLTTGSSSGNIKTNLTTDKGKDVGIQVNYWSTTGNASITAGSVGYKTGYFGFKKDLERWSFYSNATINNNIVTGAFGDIQVNKVFASRLSGVILDGGITCGSNNVAGSNFTISGGTIDGTPVGVTAAAPGRFTTLSNTVQASLSNVQLQGSLVYSIERYILNAITNFRSPTTSTIVSLFSVVGVNFTTSSGTMPSLGITDGTYKILMCRSMGTGCQHTVYFGPGNLVAPNPLAGTGNPTSIVFKRQGQSAQLMYDGVQSAWILIGGGAYVV